MAQEQPHDSEPASGPDTGQPEDFGAWGLCEPFMTQLPITGALISVVDPGGRRSTVAATDPVAARWDELELELGAGPLRDATTESAPQLVGDVRSSAMNPVIGAHLDRLGVRALFAFPLTLGLATVGVVGLYRNSTGALNSDSLGLALDLARWATVPAVREAVSMASKDGNVEEDSASPGLRREVHQATGMLSAQLNVNTTEAFARLRAHAVSNSRSITAVSRDVVNGLLNFIDLDLE